MKWNIEINQKLTYFINIMEIIRTTLASNQIDSTTTKIMNDNYKNDMSFETLRCQL